MPKGRQPEASHEPQWDINLRLNRLQAGSRRWGKVGQCLMRKGSFPRDGAAAPKRHSFCKAAAVYLMSALIEIEQWTYIYNSAESSAVLSN